MQGTGIALSIMIIERDREDERLHESAIPR
eukprot:COSAG02_NODE_233_length_27847_cov_20.383055_6_plen_30_part_00